MNNIKCYTERMTKTMTRAEKLFFLDHLDLHTYDLIIDFGGADGTLIYEIQKNCPDLDCGFSIIDNNPQMKDSYKLRNCTRFTSLHELESSIKEDILASIDILFICNSVLHEVDNETLNDIFEFCKKYVRTVVMRDMAYTDQREYLFRTLIEQDFEYYSNETYSIIKNNEELYNRFVECIPYFSEWKHDVIKAYTHFILKFEYKENWDTEVKENYFSNNIIKLCNNLIAEKWLNLYSRSYTLPYKYQQAREVFKFRDMPTTHMQIILQKSKEN